MSDFNNFRTHIPEGYWLKVMLSIPSHLTYVSTQSMTK